MMYSRKKDAYSAKTTLSPSYLETLKQDADVRVRKLAEHYNKASSPPSGVPSSNLSIGSGINPETSLRLQNHRPTQFSSRITNSINSSRHNNKNPNGILSTTNGSAKRESGELSSGNAESCSVAGLTQHPGAGIGLAASGATRSSSAYPTGCSPIIDPDAEVDFQLSDSEEDMRRLRDARALLTNHTCKKKEPPLSYDAIRNETIDLDRAQINRDQNDRDQSDFKQPKNHTIKLNNQPLDTRPFDERTQSNVSDPRISAEMMQENHQRHDGRAQHEYEQHANQDQHTHREGNGNAHGQGEDQQTNQTADDDETWGDDIQYLQDDEGYVYSRDGVYLPGYTCEPDGTVFDDQGTQVYPSLSRMQSNAISIEIDAPDFPNDPVKQPIEFGQRHTPKQPMEQPREQSIEFEQWRHEFENRHESPRREDYFQHQYESQPKLLGGARRSALEQINERYDTEESDDFGFKTRGGGKDGGSKERKGKSPKDGKDSWSSSKDSSKDKDSRLPKDSSKSRRKESPKDSSFSPREAHTEATHRAAPDLTLPMATIDKGAFDYKNIKNNLSGLSSSDAAEVGGRIAELEAENNSFREENKKLKLEMKELMEDTDHKFQQVVKIIDDYEQKQVEKDRKQEQELRNAKMKMQEETLKLQSEHKAQGVAVGDKDKEIALLNQLLGKKQEDFLFSIEQLKDVKQWARKTIAEVEQRAQDALDKRDQRIWECEREIYRKQETVDQVLKLLHREKTKCEKLVLSTNELTRKLEGDLEFKLRVLNREVERVMKTGEHKFRSWPFKPEERSMGIGVPAAPSAGMEGSHNSPDGEKALRRRLYGGDKSAAQALLDRHANGGFDDGIRGQLQKAGLGSGEGNPPGRDGFSGGAKEGWAGAKDNFSGLSGLGDEDGVQKEWSADSDFYDSIINPGSNPHHRDGVKVTWKNDWDYAEMSYGDERDVETGDVKIRTDDKELKSRLRSGDPMREKSVWTKRDASGESPQQKSPDKKLLYYPEQDYASQYHASSARTDLRNAIAGLASADREWFDKYSENHNSMDKTYNTDISGFHTGPNSRSKSHKKEQKEEKGRSPTRRSPSPIARRLFAEDHAAASGSNKGAADSYSGADSHDRPTTTRETPSKYDIRGETRWNSVHSNYVYSGSHSSREHPGAKDRYHSGYSAREKDYHSDRDREKGYPKKGVYSSTRDRGETELERALSKHDEAREATKHGETREKPTRLRPPGSISPEKQRTRAPQNCSPPLNSRNNRKHGATIHGDHLAPPPNPYSSLSKEVRVQEASPRPHSTKESPKAKRKAREDSLSARAKNAVSNGAVQRPGASPRRGANKMERETSRNSLAGPAASTGSTKVTAKVKTARKLSTPRPSDTKKKDEKDSDKPWRL